MNIFQSIILSIVEGITEFLPISSTGHLILTSQILKIAQTDFVKTFEIAIQLGAIMSVVFLYWQKIIKSKTLWKEILASFIPTAVIGFIFFKLIKNYLLGNSHVVVISLIIGGIALIIFEKYIKLKKKKPTLKDYFLIGIFQAIAVIPGVSRAAATIIGGELVGLDKKEAVEFSFLLAAPTMFAATALDLVKSGFSFTGNEILIMAVGFIGAFVTATLTIKAFIKFIQKNNFVGFGIYRIIVGLIFLLYLG
ncbi:MAG: undecaprenyl-diphosphatase UppP [Candidatus Woesebacteria bacterium]|nr:MAG: undecaprenyl-diphosphatase UppP [Candidatus Woesebacteria bacterium]